MTMTKREAAGRPNQRRRTRKDLLEAAARLMREGKRPNLEEVAEAALVSRATAYRYFPSIDALLLETAVDVATPSADTLFKEHPGGDPASRVIRVNAALDEMMRANEAPLRIMLAQSIERVARDGADALPARQNRRIPLIEAALAPARQDFEPKALDRLQKALSLLLGPESMVVCRDVLQLSDAEAQAIKDWAITALIAAARSKA